MNQQHFTVTLEEDVVISPTGASLGGQGTLDYLPGSVFLGVAAKKLYAAVARHDAFVLFHSGKVRFGDALLLSPDDLPTFPAPLCWYTATKEYAQSLVHGMRLEPANLRNKLWSSEGRKQVGSGYVTLDGGYFRPPSELRMKTAIDPRTGRAREAQLFGYAGLPAGLRFGFTLNADEDVSPVLYKRVKETLQGSFRIGRSRSGAYGKVWVEPTIATSRYQPEPAVTVAGKELLIVWLMADTALLDDWGQPTLTPSPAQLDLPPDSVFDASRSFIRSRRYAPFNAYYRKREQERIVLRMGSVLAFLVGPGTVSHQLAQTLAQGVGLYRQAGLGRVWLNPPLLMATSPIFDEQQPIGAGADAGTQTLNAATTAVRTREEQPVPPLISWLRAQMEQDTNARTIEGISDTWVAQIPALYHSARRLASAPPEVAIGPTASQWGCIMGLAKTPDMTADGLLKRLFIDSHAICRDKDPAWEVDVWPDGASSSCSFGSWLRDRCGEVEPSTLLPAVVYLAARHAASIVRDVEREDHHAG